MITDDIKRARGKVRGEQQEVQRDSPSAYKSACVRCLLEWLLLYCCLILLIKCNPRRSPRYDKRPAVLYDGSSMEWESESGM